MKNLGKNLLFGALIIAVLIGIVFWYTQSPDADDGVSRVSGPTDESRVTFIALLRTLKTIQLDTSFFQSSAYQSLINPGVEVTIPDDRGRPNPFDPLAF